MKAIRQPAEKMSRPVQKVLLFEASGCDIHPDLKASREHVMVIMPRVSKDIVVIEMDTICQ